MIILVRVMKKSGTRVKILGLILLVLIVIAAALLYPLVKIRYLPSESHQLHPAGLSENAGRLHSHVEALSSGIGPRSAEDYDALVKSMRYIIGNLNKWGYTPVVQEFEYKGKKHLNIEASIKGSAAPQEIILVGAHYDTVEGTPGADDNASAVAVLLEMCRMMKGSAPARTLKFVFFDLEERPAFATRFMGSEVYATSAREAGADIRGMVCLEMLGYFSDRIDGQSIPLPLLGKGISTTPNFIAIIGNEASQGLVGAVRKSLESGCRVPVESLVATRLIPGVDFSDHRSFWRAGYEAVMVTDTAFYRNPNYHTSSDTIETLDFEKMADLLKGLVKTAEDLSNTKRGQ